MSTKYYFADLVIKTPPPFADQIFTQKVADFAPPPLFADQFRKEVFRGLPSWELKRISHFL